MHCNVNDLLYSQCSHQHVSAAAVAIFGMLLLQEYRDSNVVSCVVLTPY